ncbi:MAG: hypothetical protein AB1758_19280, partial [Candidatus Eremiobacterota bacterium]
MCGQPLQPGEQEKVELVGHLDYLLREAARWTWMAEKQRGRIVRHYQERREFLEGGPAPRAEGPIPIAPEVATVDHLLTLRRQKPQEQPPTRVPAEPAPDPGGQAEPLPAPQGPPLPEPVEEPERPVVHALSAFLEENNIRWFHTLGALLILAACIGVLRSPWAGYAKPILALLMIASPAGCFYLAGKLQERLPMSGRILTVLGGLLFPSGLLALNAFVVHAPTAAWNSFSFAASTLLMGELARRRQDVVCL